MSRISVVALGSQNPVKRRAVARVLADAVTLQPVDVPSGVPDQPEGHAETRQGAINRAVAAHEAHQVDLGIGLEGGIGPYPGVNATFVIMWAAVSDGNHTVAAPGPGIPLPDEIVVHVDANRPLGAVLATEFGDRAREEGAAGIYTDGLLDREDALYVAAAAALGRYRTR